MRHAVEAQKTAGPERYAIDGAAKQRLLAEVYQGLLRAQRWLATQGQHAMSAMPYSPAR